MTDHEKLVQIASTALAYCVGWACEKSHCPVYKKCNLFAYEDITMLRQQLRFAAAKKLTREARDE